MALKATKAQQGVVSQGELQMEETIVFKGLIRMMLSKEDSMKVDSCKVMKTKIVIRSL